MLQVILLPLLAVLGGAGGFFLRRRELSAAFESSGLAIPWAPSTMVLIAWSVLFALALALLCRGSKHELKQYDDAFSAAGNWAYLAVSAVAAAFLLVASLFGLKAEFDSGAPRLLHLLFYGMCAVSFVAVLTIIPGNFRAKGRQYSLALLLPAYTCCLWLVTFYQQRASDPVVLDYVYELFAIVCTLLGFYFAAAFSFGRGRIWLCSFFCLLSVYFSIVTLADGHGLSIRLLLLFSALYQLATVTTLLYHAFIKGPVHAPDESNKTQEVTPDE